MDAPLSATSQGYDASEVHTYIDPDLVSLLSCFVDDSNSECFVNDLSKEPSRKLAYSSFNGNESSNVSAPASVPSECIKLQARVYNRLPSLILSYTPLPSAKLVDFQYSPAQPLRADVSTPLPAQPVLPDVSAPLVVPSRPITADLAAPVSMPLVSPSHFLHADVAAPVIIPLVSPSHFLHADVASHISAPNMPPHPHITMPMPPQQQQPPHQFDACPNVMCTCKGSQSHEYSHHNFTFSISDVEATHKNQLPYDAFHDRSSKLTAPILSMHHQYLLQNSMKLAPPKLEVPTSPIACVTSGTASPAYMQSSIFSMADNSDSPAMDISSMSAPAAQATSNSSFYSTSKPPQWTSLSVPPSPTPSVNKKESSNEERGSSPHGLSQVFKVKTKLLNLHDGFSWKKYGEKIIKKQKYPRSYFKCGEKKCKVVKRTQRCSNEEDCVLFAYLGRHNHPH